MLEFLAVFDLTKELTLALGLVRRVVSIFLWAAALLVLSAALLSLSAQLLRNDAEQLWPIFQTLEFSANLVKLGLLLVLLVCTIGLKIPWKGLPAGLILGSHLLKRLPGSTTQLHPLGARCPVQRGAREDR
jgi:Na+-driven multidrug efflux pump